MRVVCLCSLIVAGLALIGGCTSDDDTGGGAVIAQGTLTVPGGGTATLATVSITQPGVMTGTIVWSGAPTEIEAGFRHVVPSTVYGFVIGSSPATTSVAVTSARVAAGTEWELVAAVPGSTAASLQYEVSFTPD
jgi:hypothetical protein